MLGHLVRKEILDHLLSLRFLILSGIAALVIGLGLYDGYATYREYLREYHLAVAATEDRRQQLEAADSWAELDALGYEVHKPPAPMSVLVRGLEPILGRSVLVSGAGKWLPARSPATSEPILGLFPPMDMGMIVQVVLSLFVLLFTYDAVCGEKEAGTLRLVASLPVARHRLLLGKLIGTLVPILAAFGLPLLLGVAILLLLPGIEADRLDPVRLGLIFVAFGAYLAVFACAGIFVSSLVHRSTTSFVVLLVLWAGFVAILPRLSLVTADRIRPAPSIHELQSQKEAIRSDLLERRHLLVDKWTDDYEKSRGEDWWKTPEGREAQYTYYSDKRLEFFGIRQTEYARLEEAFYNRYNARMSLSVGLGRLSPAFALGNAVVRLASTGVDRHRAFQRAIEEHRSRHEKWLYKTKDRDRFRQMHPAKYGQYKWDVADMPAFTYRDSLSREDLQAALFDIGLLAVWGLLLFAGAHIAFLRYDLR